MASSLLSLVFPLPTPKCRDCNQTGVETELSPCGCRLCRKCWGFWHSGSSKCTTPCVSCGNSQQHGDFPECLFCHKKHCSKPECVEECAWEMSCHTCMEATIEHTCNKGGCSFGACTSCWEFFHKNKCPECDTYQHGSSPQKCTFCDEVEVRMYEYDTPQEEREIPTCSAHRFYPEGKLLTLQMLCLIALSKIGPIPEIGIVQNWKKLNFPDRP